VILVRNKPEDMAIPQDGATAGPILKMEEAEKASVNLEKSPPVWSRHALRNLTVWLPATLSPAGSYTTAFANFILISIIGLISTFSARTPECSLDWIL
jgi:hypothetical protein